MDPQFYLRKAAKAEGQARNLRSKHEYVAARGPVLPVVDAQRQARITFHKTNPRREKPDGVEHRTLWRGQAGRCFYCLREITPYSSRDHFIPYSHRTIEEHASGQAENIKDQVLCCKRTNHLLADSPVKAKLAQYFPGFSVQIGGSLMKPCAQPCDCLDESAPSTPPLLLHARHRFIRARLLGTPVESFLASVRGTGEDDTSFLAKPLDDWRSEVRHAVEAARSAIRQLVAVEKDLGQEGFLKHAETLADPDFDSLIRQADAIVAPSRTSDDVSNRFQIAWSSELGLHVEKCDMQWRVLKTIPFGSSSPKSHEGLGC